MLGRIRTRATLCEVICLAITAAAAGCEATASGDLEVVVEAEDTIIAGIEAGQGPAHIRDGWALTFDRYVAVIGDIDLHLSADANVQAHAEDAYAIDLTKISAAGEPLWTLSDLRAGNWEFAYATPGADDGAHAHDTVAADDFSRMRDGDLTYLIVGSLAKPDGQSCPPSMLAKPPMGAAPVGENASGDPCYAAPTVGFDLGAPAPTVYGPCEIDGKPGVSIPDGGSQVAAATIHGDHLFFNGFPEGGEGGVLRLAQWLADCDLDLDGQVTRAELESIAPSDLAEIDDRYQLGGSPITPLETMWDYVQGQLKTQGHFQGEGECAADAAG